MFMYSAFLVCVLRTTFISLKYAFAGHFVCNCMRRYESKVNAVQQNEMELCYCFFIDLFSFWQPLSVEHSNNFELAFFLAEKLLEKQYQNVQNAQQQ